jgi:pyruvate dehydrogenase E2 component (dihydrolipoamide acetyltransferase)
MPTEFVLPELGENIASGDVVRVLVEPGDTVARDQPVVELETDKATVEVPSSVSGVVREVRVNTGDTVKVGQVVLVVDEGGAPVAPEVAGSDRRESPAGGGTAAGHEAPPPAPVREGETPVTRTEADAAPAPGLVEMTLPELGEGVAGGDVLRVLVSAGDRIDPTRPVLELETDKATIEVPSSVTGLVKEIRVAGGDTVTVGQVVLLVEGTAASPGLPGARSRTPGIAEDDEWPSRNEPAPAEPVAPVGHDAIVGGFEMRVPGKVRRGGPDKPGMHEDALLEAEAEGGSRPRAEVVSFNRGGRGPADGEAPPVRAPAAPSVRRVARELGVDIAQVPGSGPGGRISADDVKAHVKRVMSSGGPRAVAAPGGAPAAHPPLPDFARWGAVERQAMRAVRRRTAEHLGRAWAQIPHVTQHDLADITAIDELRTRYGKAAEAAGGKLTVTAIALKVVAAALKIFPQFCASVDMAAAEIVYKKYVHIGVAVDTERGLLVPVMRDVDAKNIVQISVELAQLSEKARAGKLTIEEMQGGCFTITNLGGIGGSAFTPIVNHPEVAILGMSRGAIAPVWRDGQFAPRLMLPLSLSYDHRVIDGADGIRFLRWVCEALEQPFLLSLQG